MHCLSTDTIALSMTLYVGSTSLQCKSTRIPLKSFTFTTTLCNAIVSAIAVQSTVVVCRPQYQAIAVILHLPYQDNLNAVDVAFKLLIDNYPIVEKLI